MRRCVTLVLLALSACSTGAITAQAPSTAPIGNAVTMPVSTTALRAGWRIHSATGAGGDGAAISQAGYDTGGWYPATVPTTVLAALQAAGRYPDLYTRHHLAHVPFAPFTVPWWYRTEFSIAPAPAGTHTFLHVQGLNDHGALWVNGVQVATATDMRGAFRTYDLDITDQVRAGANALAIQVEPVDRKRDLTITWIDWNPMAPDHGMGLWQPVTISRSGPVSLRDPFVETDLPLPGRDAADLTVSVTARNDTDVPVTTRLSGSIGHISFARSVTLGPLEAREVVFDPAPIPQLHIDHPRLWWPFTMGAQPRYRLHLRATVAGTASDTAATRFGVREITTRLMPNGARRWLVNGRPVLIRGAGWTSDLLLRPLRSRVDQQLRYARAIGLNTIRSEGKLETDHFYDEADRLGLLVLPGWMCCDHWQDTEDWSAQDLVAGAASMRSQALRLRNHPSVIGFLIGSDTNPVARVERAFTDALSAARWPTPVLASASWDTSHRMGPTGVKMTGPYDWVPPGYWYDPRADGGAWGFNTETSAGASIPELEHVREMLTAAEQRRLWRSPWKPQAHAGTGNSVFNDFKIFAAAMTARLGRPTSLADFVRKAQVLQYENERAMFEAFSRNRYRSTGVIQWMLNNAWPSLHWNLFDHGLEPNGSTFGATKANEPVHIQYSYDDGSVVAVNQTPHPTGAMTASAEVLDLDGMVRTRKTVGVALPADGVRRVATLSVPPGIGTTYFVRLTLRGDGGRLVSTNTYWLSTRTETLDWRRTRWYVTPTRTYADFRDLATLPTARPAVHACEAPEGPDGRRIRVTIANPGPHVAFFIRLRVVRPSGTDVVPVTWTDDDLTLMPGERRTVTATYGAPGSAAARLMVSGWNVKTRSLGSAPPC